MTGKNVFVHCAAGISRSSSFVIGFIMKKYGMTFGEGFSYVKEKRNFINPNSGFRDQL